MEYFSTNGGHLVCRGLFLFPFVAQNAYFVSCPQQAITISATNPSPNKLLPACGFSSEARDDRVPFDLILLRTVLHRFFDKSVDITVAVISTEVQKSKYNSGRFQKISIPYHRRLSYFNPPFLWKFQNALPPMTYEFHNC